MYNRNKGVHITYVRQLRGIEGFINSEDIVDTDMEILPGSTETDGNEICRVGTSSVSTKELSPYYNSIYLKHCYT